MALMTGSSASNATLYSNPARAILWPARAVSGWQVIQEVRVDGLPSIDQPFSWEWFFHSTYKNGDKCGMVQMAFMALFYPHQIGRGLIGRETSQPVFDEMG